MGIIKAKQLVHEYIRRDEEGNVESIQMYLEKNKSFFKYILLFLKKLKTILKYSIV